MTKTEREQSSSESKALLKYSKSSSFYTSTFQDYYLSNDKLLNESLEQNQLYTSQPNRINCKICSAPLPQTTDLHSHNVDYVFCEECSHLNGRFEDTKLFADNLYTSEDGAEYATLYLDDNFLKRTTDIYIPKVDFLISSLPTKKYKILDVGCGCGYFVCASLIRNLSASGLDVSKTMVDFGNNQISRLSKNPSLTHTSEEGFFDSIIDSDADVISAIGVLEHLREPHKFFTAFQKSKAKYLYYSVPMFSFSVAIENVFSNIFPRQLSGGHTHLFTDTSIKKMNEIIGIQSVAEWRFGADIMDLHRHILTSLQANKSSQKMIDFFNAGFGKTIDNIQSIIDKSHFCSEIHIIAAKH